MADETGELAGREGAHGRGTRGTGKRRLLAGGAALALLAALAGTWATHTWPFTGDEHYCWGAWRENSGPDFLGDETLEDGNGKRVGTERAPTPRRPTGTCTVAIDTWRTAGNGDKVTRRTEIEVTYGPAPKGAAERAGWVVDHLGGDALPLPDGLPGTVHGLGGTIVLPKRCDTADGRPTVVTLAAGSTDTWSRGSMAGRAGLGGTRSVAALLVAAANRGMEAAGCAAGRPFELVSPVLQLPERAESLFTEACRIPGFAIDKVTGSNLEYQVGAVDRDLQSCSVRLQRGLGRFYDAVMVAEPRLAALLDGVTGDGPPAPGWRGTGVFTDDYGIVRADCAGRPATFVMVSMPRDAQEAFTDAVTGRLGCDPLAPRHTQPS
ncbi:hypothetical protein ACFYNZ_15095 [Streptomyces kebangsaanensis]|uniref:Uncharacterized protein n=1 Tax=Streptomyces kebangsaanensis TaxID=864058 RepID=A0ABW6KWM0_9ACTN